MRILCTSDIHRNKTVAENILKTIEREKIDVFINAGDFLDNEFAYEFFRKLKVRSFIVPGNWDYGMKFKSVRVSVDNLGLFEYDGYHFLCAGSGAPFRVDEIAGELDGIDGIKLIFITHYPPYGVLDRAWSNTHAGYGEYKEFIASKKPCMHVFGHIHESNGTFKFGDTLAINCALADYGMGRGYIVELPSKKIKAVSLNEKESYTPFKFQSTVSRIVRERKQNIS